jgi:HEAT repeat protein
MKRSVVIFLLLCGYAGTAAHIDQAPRKEANQKEPESVPEALEGLYSDDFEERERAKETIKIMAWTSTEQRSEIIHALIEIFKSTSLDNPRMNTETWYDAADLLGEFEATEAIDTLIENLDYTTGTTGLSLASRPAVRAIIKIGQPATQKLIGVLFSGTPKIRLNAAIALGRIGGKEAGEALKRALLTETDEETILYIELFIENKNKR